MGERKPFIENGSNINSGVIAVVTMVSELPFFPSFIMKDNRQSGNGAIYDSTFVVSAFSASHEGCLTLPLWAKMTYYNCKFAYNLNKFSKHFHHFSAECKKKKEI